MYLHIDIKFWFKLYVIAYNYKVVRYVPGKLDAWSNAHAASNNMLSEIMIYPSSLMTAKVLTPPDTAPVAGDHISNYTKHYYIGSERISSTLGTMKDLGLADAKDVDYFPDIRTTANHVVINATDALSATYTQLEQSISLPSPQIEGELNRYEHDAQMYDAYWYHSDHLGSSSYISNREGNVSQHMEYLPFGELLVDEHFNSYNTPFKFNGKELDEETGNYYYGARYYNPKTSIWLSVDPLADKYPGWSPYNYTMQNPINLTDPTGMSVEGDATDPPSGTYVIVYGAGWIQPSFNSKKGYQAGNFRENAEAQKQNLIDSGVPESSIVMQEVRTKNELIDVINTEYDSGEIVQLDYYGHSYANGLNLGGYDNGQEPSDRNPTYREKKYRLFTSRDVVSVNKNNFSKDSKVTFWGCNTANVKAMKGKDPIAQVMANWLDLGGNNTVRGFNNYSIHKKDKAGELIYDGTMIKEGDQKNGNVVNLTVFKPKRK